MTYIKKQTFSVLSCNQMLPFWIHHRDWRLKESLKPSVAVTAYISALFLFITHKSCSRIFFALLCNAWRNKSEKFFFVLTSGTIHQISLPKCFIWSVAYFMHCGTLLPYVRECWNLYLYKILLLVLLLFNWTANGVLPGGSGTTIRHNTQQYAYHTK
jgi:hypothetical protein